MNPQEAWLATMGQLQLQMNKGSFETWVHGARVLAYKDGAFTIGVPNEHAREFLDKRLRPTIERTLGDVMDASGSLITVEFTVWSPVDLYGGPPESYARPRLEIDLPGLLPPAPPPGELPPRILTQTIAPTHARVRARELASPNGTDPVSTEASSSSTSGSHVVGINPKIKRDLVKRLAGIGGEGSAAAWMVWDYLQGCVHTADGWTYGLTQGFIAQELGTTRSVVNKAFTALDKAAIILDNQSDEQNRKRTRYRLAGYEYVMCASGAHIEDVKRTLPGDASEMCALNAQVMSLVEEVVNALRSGDIQQLLSRLLGAGVSSPSESYGVPQVHTFDGKCAADAQIIQDGGVSVRLPHTFSGDISGKARNPDAQAMWLSAFGVKAVGPIVALGHEDAYVLGALLDRAREIRDGVIKVEQAPKLLFATLKRGDPVENLMQYCARLPVAVWTDLVLYAVAQIAADEVPPLPERLQRAWSFWAPAHTGNPEYAMDNTSHLKLDYVPEHLIAGARAVLGTEGGFDAWLEALRAETAEEREGVGER